MSMCLYVYVTPLTLTHSNRPPTSNQPTTNHNHLPTIFLFPYITQNYLPSTTTATVSGTLDADTCRHTHTHM